MKLVGAPICLWISALVGACCLAGAGCGYSEEQMQEKIARIQDLESQLAEAGTQRQALEARLADIEGRNAQMAERLRSLGQEVEGLEAQRGSLQSNLEETRRALEELRARERAQQARLATFRQMLERFRSMIDSGRLRVRIVRNRMVVELSNNILFDSGRARLKPEGQAALTEIAAVLQTIRNREFQVGGHTDNVPMRSSRFASNWHLSTARAVVVARFLIQAGVPANRLSAAGYADTQPTASNDTPEGRQANRRIEIVLMPNLDELPDLSSLTTGRRR